MILTFQSQSPFSYKIKLILICSLIFIILYACDGSPNPPGSPGPTDSPPSNPTPSASSNSLSIKTDSPSDKVIVVEEDQKRILSIYSSSGIGNAAISLVGNDSWQLMFLRFHLKGLENLSIQYADIEISASISSAPPYEIRESQIVSGGSEQALDNTSSLWMDIQLVSSDGKPPGIPLEAGYIQVVLPEEFYRTNPATLLISWIDFYR